MASLLLGNLGSSLLGPLGGWIGSAIGSMIDNALFAPKAEDQHGPRLDDLNVTRGDPGAAIPIVYGADRIAGTVIASSALIETVNKEKAGGKGGGTTYYSYTYHVTIDYMLCEGPILGVCRIWAEGNLIRGTREQIEANTADNQEHIGGIPYPTYYKKHLYYPEMIPANTLPTNPRSDGYYYQMRENRSGMSRLSSSEAEAILASKTQVVYWRDTVTGYYIPVPQDHAYGVTKEAESKPDYYKETVVDFGTRVFQGNSGAFTTHYLWETVDNIADLVTTAAYTEGSEVALTARSVIENVYSFGADISSRLVTVGLAFYAAGTTNTVDGNEVGEYLDGREQAFNCGGDVSLIQFNFGQLPAGAYFVVVYFRYSLLYPLLTGKHTIEQLNVRIKHRAKFASPEISVRGWYDYWNLYDAINDFSSSAVLTFSGVDNITVYRGLDDQPIDQAMKSALLVELEDDVDENTFEIPAYIGRAHVVLDTLQLADFGNRVPSLTFEVVQFDDVRIGNVLSDLMDRAGVSNYYYDVSGLPDTGVSTHVLGYSIGSKVTYRAAMETIMEAFRIDGAEIGDQLVFRQRNRGVDHIVPYADLAARKAGSKLVDKIELVYRDAVELPRNLTVRFKDVERDYQANTAQYMRHHSVAAQDSLVEVASVLPFDYAKLYARDKMRDLWLERVSVKITLPPKYIYIHPTDIVRISDDGEDTIIFKVTKRTRAVNGMIELEGVVRREVLSADSDDSEITVRGPWNHKKSKRNVAPFSLVDFLDVAPLKEEHSAVPFSAYAELGFYVVISGSALWSGAAIFVSHDDGESYTQIASSSNNGTCGYAITPLGDGLPGYLDNVNHVDVELDNISSTLETISVQQLYAGFNYCIVGDEILQFMSAEKLVGYNNRWRLSGLSRGLRGTSHTTGTHSSIERFIVLDKHSVIPINRQLSYVNSVQKYKVISYGGSLADADVIEFTNTDKLRKPFAPVLVHGIRDGSNNLTFQWVRQDRIGWGLYEGQDAYFSELTSWDHLIEIYDPTGTTVVRSILYAPSADPYDGGNFQFLGKTYGNVATSDLGGINPTYTAAMQSADGYTPGNPVWVSIAKIYSNGVGYKAKERV